MLMPNKENEKIDIPQHDAFATTDGSQSSWKDLPPHGYLSEDLVQEDCLLPF